MGEGARMAAAIGGTRALYSAQIGFKNALNAQFKDVTTYAAGILLQAAQSENSTIDAARLSDIKRLIGARIEALFVPTGQAEGLGLGGRPLAPYGALLTRWISFAALSIIDAHAIYMRRILPEDLQQWLSRSTARESVSEAASPLAQYLPPHLWIDMSGLVLSDRIWKSGIATRLKIDALLSDGIRSGMSARDLAKQLEQFLLPNRAALRTNKPYGSDASYDAMRLARSEISRAHAEASKMAAIANPFVTGLDWSLSARHPRVDVCDSLATIGMSGQRLKDPYPAESAPTPIVSSHPMCLCVVSPFVSATPAQVVADLRQQMQLGQPAPLTPLSTRNFLSLLLGQYLASEALRIATG